MRPLSLYLHIPFCKRRCSYCTFYHLPHIDDFETAFVDAVIAELATVAADLGDDITVPTVFFGGGTPSVLSATSLRKIFEALYDFSDKPPQEITLETNPEDVTPELLAQLRELGVNRLSLGIQSMDDAALKTLKRCNARMNARALQHVADAFDNYSVDVLLGIPAARHDALADTFAALLEYQPKHFSVYCLEPGGVMMDDVGDFFDRVDVDRSADEYVAMCATLDRGGYGHYEVSNFALPGYESAHNRVYWEGGEYLGVGPGAHSFVAGERFRNVPSLQDYVDAEAGARSLRRIEERSPRQRHLEDLMLALRTVRGIDIDRLRCSDSAWQDVVDAGLARHRADRLILTERGFLLLDEIVDRLSQSAQ